MFKLKNYYTLSTLIAITIIAVTWVNFNQKEWEGKSVIQHDVVSYNCYLPAFFYEHDLSLSFLKDTVNQTIENKLYWPQHLPNGSLIIKMSMGMSVSYLPFFGAAHVFAKLFNYSTNGYSEPYQFAVLFSSLFYYIIGLFFSWKLLSLYYSSKICFISLFCLTFSTNIFYYLTITTGMSHIVNFAFIALFLYYTVQWHKKPSILFAIILGLSLGFLMLVRPIHILMAIVFLLYNINSKQAIFDKISSYWHYKLHILLIGMFAFLMILPQLLYWYYITGHYLFNSYIGEHFFFNNPHILKALFGFRKGWFIYTPIMALAIVGIFTLKNTLSNWFYVIIVFMLIYVYVTFSWWCWWYGGSFGQRPMIDVYPLLAIPLSALLVFIQSQSKTMKCCVYSLLVIFTALNLFETMQAKYNIIHYDSMTFENYIQVFGTIEKKADREHYLNHPNYDVALKGKDE